MNDPQRKPTILAIGDGGVLTGYARVVRNVLEPLLDAFAVHQLAVNYFGDPHDWPWNLYPANGRGDPFGVNRVKEVCGRVEPDLVFAVGDLSNVVKYVREVANARRDVPFVAYCPVESAPVDTRLAHQIRGATRLVLYTEFGRRAVERARAEIRGANEWDDFPELDVVPHGIDGDTFHPLEPNEPDRAAVRRRARVKLLGAEAAGEMSFVVLNANRNQPRKRIDLTVESFARFARDKDPSVKLYLHMGRKDHGWEVLELVRRHRLDERLIMTGESDGPPSCTDGELNLIYNACDVGLNTAAAEGWGLVSCEHAATRAAQIVPAHGNLGEIWDGAGETIPTLLTLTDPSGLDLHIVSPDDVAAALERLYRDSAHRDDFERKAFDRVTSEDYRWRGIAETWRAVFRSVL